jgi:hypothetical protein
MRKKNFKPMIISALLAIGFGATSVGTSFALFTDHADTAINVTAGKVDINLESSALHTFSAEYDGVSTDRVDENGNKYQSKATAVEGTFTNGGQATLANNVLTLTHITPGDRVTFTAALSDSSNVDFKYRVVFEAKAVGTGDKMLAAGMRIISNMSGTSTTYDGLDKYVSPWVLHEYDANATLAKTFNFDLELPIDAGNEYQDKAIEYAFHVEAVQGNAYTVDESGVAYLEKNLTATASAVANQALTLQTSAGDSSSGMYVKTTIPAEGGLATDDKVKLVVSNVSTFNEESSKNGTLNFDVSLYVNDVKTSSFNNQDIAVEVYIGEGYDIKSVSHNGNAITNYTYANGKILFTTKTFSPFEVVYEKIANKYGFYDSYTENGHWVHTIKNKAHFRNIDKHIKLRSELSEKNYPLADETTEYVILNNIDFGGTLWTKDEFKDLATFTGTLRASGTQNVVLSNVEGYNALGAYRTDWNSGACLLKNALNANFKYITLSNMYLSENSGKGSGLFMAGFNQDMGKDKYVKFDHVTIDSTCHLEGNANIGAFIGSSRGITQVEFSYCTNNANVVATSTNAGGFIGTGTTNGTGSNKLKFDHCTNNGNVTGAYDVGGFTGNTGHVSRVLTGTGNVNNGNVFVLQGGDKYSNQKFSAMFFSGDSWYSSSSSFEGTNTGKLYLKVAIIDNVATVAKNTISVIPDSGTTEYEALETSASWYKIYDSQNNLIDRTKYLDYVFDYTIEDYDADFDVNDKLYVNGTTPIDSIVVQIRQHCLRIATDKYWGEAPNQTNEYGGAQQGETYVYVHNQSFASYGAIDIKKVTQNGYFIPNGANEPHASYNAGFETYKLSNDKLSDTSIVEGYSVRNGHGTIVLKNGLVGADQYQAICDWRNDVQYEITGYKDGVIVGSAVVNWGRGSGDSTELQPLSFN